MGDAARRKRLDPNWGTTITEVQPLQVDILVVRENGMVKVKINDVSNCQHAVGWFNLYLIGKKMYAEWVTTREESAANPWVGKNINSLSPLICQEVVAYASEFPNTISIASRVQGLRSNSSLPKYSL